MPPSGWRFCVLSDEADRSGYPSESSRAVRVRKSPRSKRSRRDRRLEQLFRACGAIGCNFQTKPKQAIGRQIGADQMGAQIEERLPLGTLAGQRPALTLEQRLQRADDRRAAALVHGERILDRPRSGRPGIRWQADGRRSSRSRLATRLSTVPTVRSARAALPARGRRPRRDFRFPAQVPERR